MCIPVFMPTQTVVEGLPLFFLIYTGEESSHTMKHPNKINISIFLL